MKPNDSNGLREQIAAAKTHAEIDALLATGKSQYTHASFKTVRRWQVTAERRRKELGAEPPPPPPAYVSNGRAERRRARKAARAL